MKKPKLGQHFLTRPEIATWVAQTIDFSGNGAVLEIGPGHGILTKELLKVAKKVVAIEKDPSLVLELTETFSKEVRSGQLLLLQEDIRNFDPSTCRDLLPTYSLVANIPYYITGFIIRHFLTSKKQPSAMAVLVQKEVAERIVAKNNKHSLLSLSVYAYGTPKLCKVVKAGAFSPPPKVDSAILAITAISKRRFENLTQEDRFFEVIRTAFSQKRKTLGASLKKMLTEEDFSRCGINKKARPEDVPLEMWLCLLIQGGSIHDHQ
jgi:16S rRNA (adenine1518-N6/adenine1519-N6)-dimethyltransferase